MKLKRRARIIIILVAIVVLVGGGFGVYKVFFAKNQVTEAKILKTIKKYGYTLKDNKSKKYQEMFTELDKILKKDPVNEEEYAKQITQMYIYDFYTLNDKTAKTDVGGTDFVYTIALDNFLLNAEDTFYKYVESNIYNQRTQKLPVVDKVTIESIEKTSYTYGDKTEEDAYEVKATWTYTDEIFNKYQQEAVLIFIHEGIKLSLAELK